MPVVLDHPKRKPLLEELHARAAPKLGAPSRVVHLALKVPHGAAHRDRLADVAQLGALTGNASSAAEAEHEEFERVGYHVTWENHSEFSSYTGVCRDTHQEPFASDLDELFPASWVAAGPAVRIAAVVVEVLPMRDENLALAEIGQWLDPDTTAVATVIDGEGLLAGDFRPDAHGYTRFVLFVSDAVGQRRIGRTVQRVLDLETYRAMAMIGFLSSRQLGQLLTAVERRVLDLVEHLDDSELATEAVLHDLLSVSAELESLATAHAYRFGATAAYASIVEDRLLALDESRFRGRLTVSDFLARRYQPTIRTVASIEERLNRLIERAGRAADLLRTRVEVSRAGQNQALLRSMDERAETQLRLQHTVEGLSVVAISYYLLGLLGYLLAPWVERIGLEKSWVMAGLAPLVLFSAWLGMRRVRRRLEHS